MVLGMLLVGLSSEQLVIRMLLRGLSQKVFDLEHLWVMEMALQRVRVMALHRMWVMEMALHRVQVMGMAMQRVQMKGWHCRGKVLDI